MAKQFPVGANVLCSMSSFKYDSGENKYGEYERLAVGFNRLSGGDKVWCNCDIYNPKPDDFDDKEKWKKKREETSRRIWHVCENFMSRKKYTQIMKNAGTFKEAIDNLREELRKNKHWEEKVYVKSLPRGKNIVTAYYPPFVSKEPDMEYTDWEQERAGDDAKHTVEYSSKSKAPSVSVPFDDPDEDMDEEEEELAADDLPF